MARRELLDSLLTEEGYRRLYLEHLGFHLAVDGLVGMLPSLIAGMASQALEDEGRRVEAVQRIKDQPAEISWWLQGEQAPAPVEATPEPVELPVREAIPAAKPARKRAVRKAAKPVTKVQKPVRKTPVKKTTRRGRPPRAGPRR